LLDKYTAYTLVDITDSNITNSRTSDIAGYNQQQNLNTLIQLIGLRSQPILYSITILKTQDVVDYAFGNTFKGLHSVWKFEFASEHSNAYTKDDNDVYFLQQDCNNVPITSSLNETVNLVNSIFETTNKNSLNIYFIKN
jgi:hypothetical protein